MRFSGVVSICTVCGTQYFIPVSYTHLDVYKRQELKTGTLSNGTVQNYLGAITNIKKHPISERKLKNVTSEHLQAFFDLLSFGGTYPDGSERKGYSKDYIRSFSAVLQQSFRFAVSPKQYITFNPMQYIKLKYQTDELGLSSDDDMDGDIPVSYTHLCFSVIRKYSSSSHIAIDNIAFTSSYHSLLLSLIHISPHT